MDVTIRRLEWSETHSPELAGGVIAEAKSPIGDYSAWGSGLWQGPFCSNHMHRGDLATAKSAAQADFEERIRSALVP